MTLFVDYREDKKSRNALPLTPYLYRHITPRSDIELIDLHSGDVTHAGNGPRGRILNIGYEIKHIGDVLQCMEDGRLAGEDGQFEKMVRDYDVRWLVVEDDAYPDPESGVLMKKLQERRVRLAAKKRKKIGAGKAAPYTGMEMVEGDNWVPALYGAKKQVKYTTLAKYLTITCYHHGISLWRTASRDETALWLASQYQLWNDKKYHEHSSIRQLNTSHQNKNGGIQFGSEARQLRTHIMNSFAGIGYARASAIADSFRTPREMFAASEEEIAAISWKDRDTGKVMRVGVAAARKVEEQMGARR